MGRRQRRWHGRRRGRRQRGFGFGGQGGAIALFNGAAAQLASVTIAGNKAGVAVAGAGGVGSHGGAAGAAGGKGSTEGGNVFVTSATLSLRGTIIADGEGEAGKENCVFGNGGVLTSLGHNLEDRHQCLTKPAEGDLVDTPAGLGPLAANGGPTETMALLPGSAAIDAGEPACVDVAGAPLSEDQRGDPRGTSCDIGAFEVQPESPGEPGGQTPPGNSGGAGNSGGGAGPGGGSNGPRRASALTPEQVTLNKLKLSPAAVRDGKKSTVSFSLSAAVRVTFTLQREVAGVRAGKRCVAPRRGDRARHPSPPRSRSRRRYRRRRVALPRGRPDTSLLDPAGGNAAQLVRPPGRRRDRRRRPSTTPGVRSTVRSSTALSSAGPSAQDDTNG